ncbi:DUF1380 family protein [Cedecea sp. P7760]|uniref:DUF1380 family protein n=1 Tax=Cedecea sp. P7760 TaxID=2726983 RepID=UPI0015A3C780|nr:DUF1380 family protein [Cedecea sp. P7760]NWC63985.1 DUF1380 family protein [Cedecea sp. P7760]
MFGTREELTAELDRMFTPDEPLALLVWTAEAVRFACEEDKPTDEETLLLLETIGSVDMEIYREEGITNTGTREVLGTLRENDNKMVSVPAAILLRLLNKLESDLIHEEGLAWENGHPASKRQVQAMDDVHALRVRLAA